MRLSQETRLLLTAHHRQGAAALRLGWSVPLGPRRSKHGNRSRHPRILREKFAKDKGGMSGDVPGEPQTAVPVWLPCKETGKEGGGKREASTEGSCLLEVGRA